MPLGLSLSEHSSGEQIKRFERCIGRTSEAKPRFLFNTRSVDGLLVQRYSSRQKKRLVKFPIQRRTPTLALWAQTPCLSRDLPRPEETEVGGRTPRPPRRKAEVQAVRGHITGTHWSTEIAVICACCAWSFSVSDAPGVNVHATVT
jgi:hypothetical protein